MDNKTGFMPAGKIQWLLQSKAGIARSTTIFQPANLLTQAEQAVYANLKADKRRHDWLLGRYTAKQLIQQVAAQRTGQTIPLNTFSILGRPDGSPEVVWDDPPDNFACTISISHSADMAFCALVERANWPLGADVERIDRRIMGFIGAYLTAAERELIEQTVERLRPLHTTAIWSAKEAVLKALRVGLKQDTRTLSCLIAAVTTAPNDWTSFVVQWEEEPEERPLTGWWRMEGDFILAMAVQTEIV
jgi:4'-phosphopantetheinyl transferase